MYRRYDMRLTLPLLTVALVNLFLVSGSFARESRPGVDGFALSAGQLSPVELGILDESHTQIGTRIGYRIGQMQPYLVLDYARGGLTESNGDEKSFSLSLLTVGLGLKYLLAAPKSQNVQAYFSGAVFTFIPTLELNDKPIDEISDNSTAFGVLAGFGGQYAVSPRFSTGLEIGLSYSNVSADFGDEVIDVDLMHLYHMFFLEFIF